MDKLTKQAMLQQFSPEERVGIDEMLKRPGVAGVVIIFRRNRAVACGYGSGCTVKVPEQLRDGVAYYEREAIT